MTLCLQLQATGVRFGAVVALRPSNVALARGERLALLGTNGSGKTTLLRCLHGLLDAHQLDAGSSRQVAAGLREAMVFQRPFMLNASVATNMTVAMRLAKISVADQGPRGQAALQRVGLAGLESRAAQTLSGGQQQRLALARALVVKPDVLFLDEPTASLDPKAKREVEALMQGLADDGMTLVFSTHNLGQAKRLSTRVLYLEAGELVCDTTTHAFFTEPQPPQAAAFLRGEWLG